MPRVQAGAAAPGGGAGAGRARVGARGGAGSAGRSALSRGIAPGRGAVQQRGRGPGAQLQHRAPNVARGERGPANGAFPALLAAAGNGGAAVPSKRPALNYNKRRMATR